jgi:hypothetical protein
MWWSICEEFFVNFKTFFDLKDSRGKKLAIELLTFIVPSTRSKPLMPIRTKHFVPHNSHNLSLQAFFS